jgi:uncharacterized protein (DUF952 family)
MGRCTRQRIIRTTIISKRRFVHCCSEEQLQTVMKKHFQQHENLVKLVIDPTRLTQKLQYDKVEGEDSEYPHVYGPINIEAVTQIVFLDPITSDNEKIGRD